jgi:ATP-dependent DNA helicase RecG
MDKALRRLERVLELEKQQGYQNKSVVGGIRQFVIFWVTQAQEEAQGEADLALAEQVSDVLMDYGRLPGTEARAKAIDDLLASIARRPGARPQKPAPSGAAQPAAQVAERPSQPPPPPAERSLPDDQDDEPDDEEAGDDESVELEEEDVTYAEPDTAPDPAGLLKPVTALYGVGPKVAEKLEALGAQTIGDLLYTFPRRYEDYSLLRPINRLVYGEQVTIIGTIWQTRARRTRTNQVMIESIVNDGTGSIQATWFNQPWLAKQLPAGMQIVLSGKVDQYLGRLVFNSPEWEPLEMDPLKTRRIVPVYPLTKGLQAYKMREIMQQVVTEWATRVPDPLPRELRERRNLMPLGVALQQLHFPDSQQALRRARERLAFDELFLLQVGIQGQRQQWTQHAAVPLATSDEGLGAYYERLPFELTGAQQRVIGEVRADLGREQPMNRLLQGDVGSGKTAVAAAAMVIAAQAGAQSALMAPTEILAEQHYAGLSRLLEPLGIGVGLLTGSTSNGDRVQIKAALADGSLPVVIGTHALIQPDVTFARLGLAIVDEQHRFGVDQRAALRDKGPMLGDDRVSPHLLVMSATPIPRTLALSLYGTLDLSSLDEMPPGRQEIKTRWLRSSERERAYSFIRRQAGEGRQAYIIYPLVEESDLVDARAAVEEYEKLQQQVFPDLTVGLIHGRMRSEEKDQAMRAFHAGQTHVLVATSVIEVGVDVPNSTVMVIDGADRFGLAQLHQFRGRVGRGEHQSYCILIADEVTDDAEQRLRALEATNDGFVLAEKDLELRGPGEFFGRQQSGLPELRLASLLHDLQVLEMAQAEAMELFKVDPELTAVENRLLRERVAQFWEQAGDVS